jgi:hypothetical protein
MQLKGTGLGQNTGDKHGTEANKIDVGNPTTMPEVPDMNTSNKTLKGGRYTQKQKIRKSHNLTFWEQ